MYSNEQIEALRSLGYSIYFMQQETETLPLVASNIDATVCNGLFLSHDIEEFTNLKFIQLTSAGYDRVPIEQIQKRGIKLYNARGVYSIPMAEWAVFRVLEHYKHGAFFHQEQKYRHWIKHRDLREIHGKKIAVIGAGNVGQEVGKRFRAFGAETTGFDIHTNNTTGFDHMCLTETLGRSINNFDVIVVTAPLLPSTQGLINREILFAMKPQTVLVNIARGGLIDQQALCEVLTKRKDLFAALDVFETEPLDENSMLWNLENVAISPHNSFVSDGNNKRMFDVMYGNLKVFIQNNQS